MVGLYKMCVIVKYWQKASQISQN